MITKKSKCPDSELGISKKIFKKPRHNNSAKSQCTSILSWFLNVSPRLRTLDAREKLGIMSPATRILELKKQGHKIILEWERQRDSAGCSHLAGTYIYQGRTIHE